MRACDEERDQTARPRVQPQKNARAWKGESKATRPAESTIAGAASSSHRTRASEPQASHRGDIRSDKRTMRKGTKAELADASQAATNTATGSIEGRGVVQDSEGIMTVAELLAAAAILTDNSASLGSHGHECASQPTTGSEVTGAEVQQVQSFGNWCRTAGLVFTEQRALGGGA